MAFIQFKKCFSEPKQLIKLIVLVLCICFTMSQLSECVQKIMHPPVSTYYKFYLNQTLRYPSLTICRRPEYKTELYEKYGLKSSSKLDTTKAFVNFKFDQYSIADFLNETTYGFTDVFWLYGFTGKGQNTDVVDISYKYVFQYGRCHTLVPQLESSTFTINGGYWFYFKHNICNKVRDTYGISKSGFQIFLHEPNESLTGEEGQADSFLENIYLESMEEMRVILKVQSYSQISTSDDFCISDPDYSKSMCLEECFHQQIALKVECTLPWLRVPDEAGFKQCSNYTTVRNVINYLGTKRKEFLTNCNCPIQCNISIYSAHIIHKKDIEKPVDANSVISIYYSSNLVTQMNEVLSYDWNLFLSDIGGSLGFLLGLSVIGVIVVLEEIFQIIFLRCFTKKPTTPSESSQNPDDTDNTEVQGTALESYNNLRHLTGQFDDAYKKNNADKDQVESKHKY